MKVLLHISQMKMNPLVEYKGIGLITKFVITIDINIFIY